MPRPSWQKRSVRIIVHCARNLPGTKKNAHFIWEGWTYFTTVQGGNQDVPIKYASETSRTKVIGYEDGRKWAKTCLQKLFVKHNGVQGKFPLPCNRYLSSIYMKSDNLEKLLMNFANKLSLNCWWRSIIVPEADGIRKFRFHCVPFFLHSIAFRSLSLCSRNIRSSQSSLKSSGQLRKKYRSIGSTSPLRYLIYSLDVFY